MPKHVLSTLIDVVAQETELDKTNAKAFIDKLQKTKTIVIDAW
jgi:sulfite reductase alpha subunit-like flavoprotein